MILKHFGKERNSGMTSLFYVLYWLLYDLSYIACIQKQLRKSDTEKSQEVTSK